MSSGEMSLVGPRPELPWVVAQYEPWQRKRLAVPQGITGWWQVNGRSDNLMHLHTEQDIYYIEKTTRSGSIYRFCLRQFLLFCVVKVHINRYD